MGDIPALIAEGRRLIAAATPGQLEANSCGHIWASDRKLAEVSGVVQAACYPRRTAKQERADLLRFVFAVNHLAALLDVVEASERYRDARAYAHGLNEVIDGPETDAAWDDVAATLAALDSALLKLREEGK